MNDNSHTRFAGRSGRFRAKGLCMAGILLVALALRLSGITWSLPFDGEPRTIPSDEDYVMRTLRSVDFAKGEFTPTGAHIEGTLGYYIYQLGIIAAKATGILDVYPHQAAPESRQQSLTILVGRLTTAFFDVVSVGIVYLVLRRMRLAWPFACVGAVVFAVMPFEVIYSRYMRPHVLANFFVLLAMLMSVRMTQSLRQRWVFLAGFFCGLAGATRYPGVLAATVPFTTLVYDELFTRGKLRLGPLGACQALLGRGAALVLGLGLGFFLADPMLFLDFKTALAPVLMVLKSADFSQFNTGSLDNFNKLWEYLALILPKGAAPHLWILLYTAFFVALAFGRSRRHATPLAAFVLVVWYLMGKGYYFRAEFVRTLIQAFPPLAVLTGLATAVVWDKLRSRPAKAALAAALCFFIGGAAVFDVAYARGMIDNVYPDHQLIEYIKSLGHGQPVRVGYAIVNPYWDPPVTSPPFADKPEIVITPLYHDTPVEVAESQDYICLRTFMAGDRVLNRAFSEKLLARGKFTEVKEFGTGLSFAGISFDDMELPHDMGYPFVRYLVLRSAALGPGK
jgi:hypothetical protein